MNTIFKRSIILLLALLMTVGVVFGAVSCAENPDNGNGGESSASSGESNGNAGADTTDETEEGERDAYASTEKTKYNKTFVICNREEVKADMDVPEITQVLLDDAIYERNQVISRDYGVTLKIITQKDYDTVNKTVQSQATTGTDDFDMYIGHKYSFTTCAQQNYLYNLNDITTLNLDEEWWDQACYENLTVNDKTFIMTGDINPSSMRISSCYMFNKRLMEDLQKKTSELVSLTQEGDWTLDVLAEYTAGVTTNNGNDYETDRFGLVSWMMDVPFSLYYGAGKPFVTIVDGEPEMTFEDSTEPIVNVYEKIYKLIIAQNAYFITDHELYETCYDVFAEGRALFCDITLHKINSMIVSRNMKDEYGILPVPKYDTNQKEYLSFVNGSSPFVMIAKTESDPEFVGAIMEGMATYNYDNVTPNMFEIVTKLQTAQDPDSAAMVDLILRNRIYDLAYFYDWGLSNVILDALKAKSESISSDIAADTKEAKRTLLRKLVNAYSD